MKINFILSMLVLGGALFLNSCDDDEVPKSGVTFELAEQEVTESDGTIKSLHPLINRSSAEVRSVPVKLVFDRALAKNAVLKFDIDGTARQTSDENEEDYNDFELLAEGTNVTIANDEITILKGATEAIINVRILEDFRFEDDEDFTDEGIPYETMEITIESVVSGPITLGTQLTHTVKILEDDALVILSWNPADQDDETQGIPGDVNMDLFIYFNNRIFNYSNNTDGANEGAFIPAGFSNGTFSLSYVYKGGTSNNLDFSARIVSLGGTITKADGTTGEVLQFDGKYELDNLNSSHTVPGQSAPPNSKIVQTMTKSGLNYTNVTEMNIPVTGSRTSAKPTKITPSLLKTMKMLGSKGAIQNFRIN